MSFEFKNAKIEIRFTDEESESDIKWTKLDPPHTFRFMVSGSFVQEISHAEYERFVRANYGEFDKI